MFYEGYGGSLPEVWTNYSKIVDFSCMITFSCIVSYLFYELIAFLVVFFVVFVAVFFLPW